MVHKKCHKLFKHSCTGHADQFSSESTPSTPGNTREANGDALSVESARPKAPGRKKFQFHSPNQIGHFGPGKLSNISHDADNNEIIVTGQEVDGISGDELDKSESHQYSLKDFELLRVIGRGSYAKVLMVELKSTKRIYAMKVIKKELVTDDEDIDWVQTEKHVFETASNYPFLVGLHSCFQTASRYINESMTEQIFDIIIYG